MAFTAAFLKLLGLIFDVLRRVEELIRHPGPRAGGGDVIS